MHHGEARVLKRPLPVSSTEDSPLSEAVVVELNATRDVNNLRKRAKQLGVLVDYQTSDGQWHKRTKEHILDECRRRLEQSHGPVEAVASSSAGAPQPCSPDFSLGEIGRAHV